MMTKGTALKGLTLGVGLCTELLFGATKVIVDDQGGVKIDNNGQVARLDVVNLIQQLKAARGTLQINAEASVFNMAVMENGWLQVDTELFFSLQVSPTGDLYVDLPATKPSKKIDSLRIETPYGIRLTSDTMRPGYDALEIRAKELSFKGPASGNKKILFSEVYLQGCKIILDQILRANIVKVCGSTIQVCESCTINAHNILLDNPGDRVVPTRGASSVISRGSINASHNLTANNFDSFTNNGQVTVGHCLVLNVNKILNESVISVDPKNRLGTCVISVYDGNFSVGVEKDNNFLCNSIIVNYVSPDSNRGSRVLFNPKQSVVKTQQD